MTEWTAAAEQLMAFVDASPSPWHVIEEAVSRLQAQGFRHLDQHAPWSLATGDTVYTTVNDSALVAVRIGKKPGFRMVASHSDAPCFHLKPHFTTEGFGLQPLYVEPYGGMIMSSWMDRPLSVAGRLLLRGETPFLPQTKTVALRQPVATIANLCIHMNRTLNDGYTWNAEKDMRPLYLNSGRPLMALICEEAGVSSAEVLSHDLLLYPLEPSCRMGADGEWLSAPRLDNLGMVHASLEAFLSAMPADQSQVYVVCDNEEVGSQTRQGAGSPAVADVLQRIVRVLDDAPDAWPRAQAASFLISADQAHAAHPNYSDKMDVIHAPQLNGGPVLKGSAAMSYASDGYSAAVIAALAAAAKVPLQQFRNRADMRGGATMGPILSRHLNIPTADIGNPLLAMHSARETGGAIDQWYMIRLMREFYSH